MAIQGTPIPYKVVSAWLDSNNMNVTGNHIPIPVVDAYINNVLPANPSCKECNKQELDRLTYIGKYRDAGLSHGRYTGNDGNLIRTYDVKYNHGWVLNYANKSCNAAGRGQSLNNSTHVAHMKHKLTNNQHFKVAIDALKKIK